MIADLTANSGKPLAQKPSVSSEKRILSGIKGNSAAAGAQKPNSATNKKPSSAKGQVVPGNSTKIASELIEPQSGNNSNKEKKVVPESSYAADCEDIMALIEEVNQLIFVQHLIISYKAQV